MYLSPEKLDQFLEIYQHLEKECEETSSSYEYLKIHSWGVEVWYESYSSCSGRETWNTDYTWEELLDPQPEASPLPTKTRLQRVLESSSENNHA